MTLWSIVLTAGCLPVDDCRVDTWRCDRDELEICVGHPSGVYGPIDDPSYTHGSGPDWENSSSCGANRCITPADGSDPFCALDTSPDPACTVLDACSDTTAVSCHEGYAVERELCRACSATACLGSWNDPCATDADCADGLRCNAAAGPLALCQMPCACADGVTCAPCSAVDEVAPGNGSPIEWQCEASFCQVGP